MCFSGDEGYFLPLYLYLIWQTVQHLVLSFFGINLIILRYFSYKLLSFKMVLLTWTSWTAFSVHTNLIVTGELWTNHLVANNVTILQRQKGKN